MKFCKRKRNSYISCGKVCSTDYILSEDVLAFHGKAFFEKWNEYKKVTKVNEKDQQKLNDLKKKLTRDLNLSGEAKLKYELKQIEKENNDEKDLHFEKYIMQPYNDWKQQKS